MPIPTARLALSVAVLSLLSSTGFATDFYVDVLNGSNANSGTSPASAWQTLTFATTAAASGPSHTVHVAPGTYSPASGETFPLLFQGQKLVGDQGSAVTIVDAGSASHVFEVFYYYTIPPDSALSGLKGMTLRNAGIGIWIEYALASLSLTVEDVEFRDMSWRGISARANPFQANFAGSYHLDVRRTRFRDCYGAVSCSGNAGSNSFDMVECSIDNCFIGIEISTRALVVGLDRCSIRNCTQGATVAALSSNSLLVNLNACEISGNGRGYVASTYATGSVSTTMTHCTIASNLQNGVIVDWVGAGAVPSFDLRSTLLHGNGTDYSSPNPATASFSQIGGASPLFRNATVGDFRLSFGSPAIDTGDPATVVGTLDLNGVARSVDGDLDLLERADIGCFEFRTLDIATSGQQGTLLTLEVFGSLGGSSAMRISQGPLAGPVPTQFGEFDLSLASNLPWITFPTAPGPGFLVQRLIPTTPMLIGQTYSFQGLVTSSASTVGAAWSNAVSFTIVP